MADRGRKANLYANKFTYNLDVQHRQKLHRQRLRSMGPAIDNKAPKKHAHLRKNLKREQMMEERFSRIERENRILLEKMSHIMQNNTLDNRGSSWMYAHSLNKEYRKRELQRITVENQSILKRIQAREPYYNHVEWDEERKQQESLLKNICEHPYKDPLKKKGRRRRRRQVVYDDEEDDYYESDMMDRPLEGSAGGMSSVMDSRDGTA